MNSLSFLSRYASLVDDLDAFRDAAQRPLPTCIWVNPLKAKGDRLSTLLNGEFQPPVGYPIPKLEAIPWYEGAFRAEGWSQPGGTLPFVAGWYLVQEEIAMTAVAALDPQPGEAVLDLCAAPGNKTVQIAARLSGSGWVLANESSVGRLASLWNAIARMGLLNVMTINEDGRSLPLPPHSFDRVLVDAPCSGEGTVRKHPHRNWSMERSMKAMEGLIPVQKALLDRALQLVKPGGVVVYSTCTFSPEENEAVLDAVLGDRAFVEPIQLPGLSAVPGLTTWQGQSFRSDLANAHRYFPHINNTGGFFMARLRRTDAGLDTTDHENLPLEGANPKQAIAPGDASLLQAFGHRFGLPADLLDGLQLWEKGRGKLWLAEAQCQPLPEVEIQNLGLPLFRTVQGELKPTTAALQRFGPSIKRQVVELTHPDMLRAFMAGESQHLDLSDASLESGYVHVRSHPFELGCGRLQGDLLHSQLPKTLRL